MSQSQDASSATLRCRSCPQQLAPDRPRSQLRIRGFSKDYGLYSCSKCQKVKVVVVEQIRTAKVDS